METGKDSSIACLLYTSKDVANQQGDGEEQNEFDGFSPGEILNHDSPPCSDFVVKCKRLLLA